jgi:phage gp36-like protein
MTYCTIAQFIEIFSEQEAIELTNLDMPGAIATNDDQLTRALTDASAMIDGYIQNRVQLPLEPEQVPGVLVSCCADIARYRLDRLRCREEVRLRYEDWIAWLKDVARGLVNLGLDSQVLPASPTLVPDQVYIRASDRVFTEHGLRGF